VRGGTQYKAGKEAKEPNSFHQPTSAGDLVDIAHQRRKEARDSPKNMRNTRYSSDLRNSRMAGGLVS
jgi:hypothetical protein